MKKILICGGHLSPAIALIEEFEIEKDIIINFIGRKYSTEGSSSVSQEFKIVTEKKIKFYCLTTGRFQRKFTRFTIPSLLKIPIGFLQSFIYLLSSRPNIVVSFGGYISCPVIMSAWLLGIKSITHEQSIVPCLANKINSIFVEKIYLSWQDSEKYFDKNKTKSIGNLIRKDIFASKAENNNIIKILKNSNKLIYVTGGNQGSHIINSLIFSSINIFKNFNLIHQVGATNFQGDLEKANKLKSKNYLPIDFTSSQNIGAILKKAEFIISRSGANTVWELAALAKPIIFIPLEIAASNEQYQNAEILERAGSAVIIEEKNLNTSNFKKELDTFVINLNAHKNAAEKFQKTIPRDASTKLKLEILRYT